MQNGKGREYPGGGIVLKLAEITKNEAWKGQGTL